MTLRKYYALIQTNKTTTAFNYCACVNRSAYKIINSKYIIDLGLVTNLTHLSVFNYISNESLAYTHTYIRFSITSSQTYCTQSNENKKLLFE